jgi:AcrR family transcriptional regulator
MENPNKKPSNITRPRDSDATRGLLIKAVGELLAEKGFAHLGVNAVARQAGVDKVLIYRYFGGLPGLIKAFGQEEDFWPSIEELAGGDIESFRKLALPDKMNFLGSNFIKAIRDRPLTQEIMAWEMIQRNELTIELETIRETRMLKFAEMFFPPETENIDLMAIIAIIGAGISYLACRARWVRWYNGVDLKDDEGWQRIESGVRRIINGIAKEL